MRRLSTARPFRQGAELHQRRPRCLSLDAAPGAWWQYESTSQLQMQVRTPKHARGEVNSFCSLLTESTNGNVPPRRRETKARSPLPLGPRGRAPAIDIL